MKTQHTKGEWFLSGGNEIVSMPSQMHIARVDYVGDHEEHEANGKLIAAAPELLEACKTYVNNFEASHGPIEDLGLGKGHSVLIAQKAIKKATS